MNDEPTIYFHEDDYCQIELLPTSARDFVQDQARQIDEFSDAHWTGYGWTDMYVRSEPPVRIDALKIKIKDLDQLFPSTAKRFARVPTGYASHREIAPQTLAWEEAGTLYYADHDTNAIVQHIWLDIWNIGEAAKAQLQLLGIQLDILLADWAWSRVVNLQDAAMVAAYLRERSGGGAS